MRRSFRIRLALSCIQRRLHDPTLALRDVARDVNLSPEHLTRLMRQQTGLGFRDTLRQCRMKAARALVEQSAHSVKEIASATGYADAPAFNRHFKRTFGLSPTLLREQPTADLTPQDLTMALGAGGRGDAVSFEDDPRLHDGYAEIPQGAQAQQRSRVVPRQT